MAMFDVNIGCANFCGDEDCNKCMKRGILLTGCPSKCSDYISCQDEAENIIRRRLEEQKNGR